ncbi:polysaccharide deacetylase family protein [Candidatus Sumerlaeota bacterium]|nr:polysaccharide deacetylase family protein [Candidatus Sumerlaeota bacterium]
MSENAPNVPAVLLQVDLDSLWAIRQVYGLGNPDDFHADDPVYDLAVERFLDLFESRGVRATFFAIGRDCLIESRACVLSEAAARGHEIANHSHTHPIAIGSLGLDAVREEVTAAQEAIRAATGTTPRGFRSPGYALTPEVLQSVIEAGLDYDASLLPTCAARWLRLAGGLFRKGGRLSGTEGQYGAPQAGRAPTSPYFADPSDPWNPSLAPSSRSLLEIPVAVTPRLRLPVHCSIAIGLGWAWTRRALDAVCREAPAVAYVFHGIDLLGGDETTGLPGGVLGRRAFLQPYERKRRIVGRVLDLLLDRGLPILSRDFAVVRCSEKT